ncbi:hypothetical protein ALC56_05215 [Trachymyrmex septentrionalis]|uniref:Uncharacterized protein n=1 Tax=Trachymyrmex septentrionalis TaxID=34720 RepID=A0A195FHV1_9HYME|nr:hypothetical protein ALC56_05215 [Trachymyrmex septentrionalis]
MYLGRREREAMEQKGSARDGRAGETDR